MKNIMSAIALALRSQDFMLAESLWRDVPMSMRRFRRQKIRRPGKYIAGGRHANVSTTPVKNPAIAAQMNAMHDRWFAKRFA
jgi:hypothetical protein